MTEIEIPEATPPALTQDPALIAAYLKLRKNGDNDVQFADFIGDLKKTDFDDVYGIRAILESQAHLLAALFQYLMIEGDWRSLPMALRAQKMMMDTIDTMNGYPSEAFRRSYNDPAPENHD